MNDVLIDELAKFICNNKHSGIDVWSMAAEEVRGHWRTEARYVLGWLRKQFDEQRPDFGSPVSNVQ